MAHGNVCPTAKPNFSLVQKKGKSEMVKCQIILTFAAVFMRHTAQQTSKRRYKNDKTTNNETDRS